MEFGTREQKELLFATGVQQDFPLGRIPVAAEEDLKDYDPAKPIHRGWDSYRYAPKEVDAGAAAETSLQRAMRLRREFLDALKECGAPAAQEIFLLEGGEPPAAKEPRTDDGVQHHDTRGGSERSTGEGGQGQQKGHPAAPAAHPPQPQLSTEPAATRSLPFEDTPTIHDRGGTVSLDVDAGGKGDLRQREEEGVLPPSGTKASGGRRKPSIPVMDVLPEDRVSLAGDAVGDIGRNAEKRDEGGGEKDEEKKDGRGLEGRRVRGVMAETGEETSTRTSGGEEFDGDFAKAVGPSGPAAARPKQHQGAEAVEFDPPETKDGRGYGMRFAERHLGGDSSVVSIQKRSAEGAAIEFGNSGVWEHMEGEVGTPTGGTIMKAMIAGIMVSVPLPSEAFCAWGKRASPTDPGGNDSRPAQDDDNSHTNKPTREAPVRARSRRENRSHNNTGTTERGVSEDDTHPLDADTTELSAPRKSSKCSAVEGTIIGTSGEQEARTRRRRSSSSTAIGPSTPAPAPPPAAVARTPPMDHRTRTRESHQRRQRDQDDLPPGEEEDRNLMVERAVGDQAITGRRDSAQVPQSNNAARRAQPPAATSDAGGRSRATARGEAADTGTGDPASSEGHSAPSRRRVRDELCPAEGPNNTRRGSIDVGVGCKLAAQTATWDPGSRVEEDQGAAAAASAIAGVGWRSLRRDTVTALVRQLGRATAERDRIRQQPEIDLRNTWPREDDHGGKRYLPSSPPTHRRVHQLQHSEGVPVAAATAAAAGIAPPPASLPLYGDNNGVPASAWNEYQPRHRSSRSSSSSSSSSQRRKYCGDSSGSTGAAGTRNTEVGGSEEADPHRRRWRQAGEAGAAEVPCGFPSDSPVGRRRASAGGGPGDAPACRTPYEGGHSPSRQQENSRRGGQRQRQGTSEFGVSGELAPISSPSGRYVPRTGLEQAGFASVPSPSARHHHSQQQQQQQQQGSAWTREVEATAGLGVSSIPSPAGQAGCSPRPRSTRQAALLMRGAIRSLVRLALLSAWRRWRAALQPPPRPRQQRSTSPPGAAAAVPNCGSGREGRVGGGKTSTVRVGGGDGEASAAAAADKEKMWRQRQAVLLSFVTGSENGDNGRESSGEGARATSPDTAGKATATAVAATAVTAAAAPAPRVTAAVNAESLGEARVSSGHDENSAGRRPPRSLATRNPAGQQRGREMEGKGEEPDGDEGEGEEKGGRNKRETGGLDGGRGSVGGAKALVMAEGFRNEIEQCSESSSRLEGREAAKRRQQLPPPPAPLRSPRSPEGVGEGGASVLTPGSRRSRNSMQRQTFSASSSNSSWKDRGNQEQVDDLYGPVSPAPPFPPAVSPIVRRWRQPAVDHQLVDTSSPATMYGGDAAAASPLAFAVDLGGSSPKSPASIHGRGYRSPRFGASNDGEGDVDGGGDGEGFTPARSLSGTASRGGASAAAAAAREATGWTRPVLEGGSLRLAADERNKAAPWRPPGSPGSVNVVATSVAAAAAASAAMARPAIDVRRRRSSGGTSRRSSTGRQTGSRVVPPEEELFHGGGGGERDEGGPGPGYGEEESPRSAGGAYEEWLAGARGGTGAGLFDPPSSATAAGHTPVKAAPSRPSLERQQSHQQRATPMYLAPTASSRHKHKPKTTNSKAEASHPAKTEASTPKRRGRRATRTSFGVGNSRALADASRPAFRPGGIAKPTAVSPPPSPSPSPPRTRKQSLERREALQSARGPCQQRGRAVPLSKRGGGGADDRLAASPPRRVSGREHGSSPPRPKPQRHPQQRRRPRPSPQALSPERDQDGRGGASRGVWDNGRGLKQQQDVGEGGGRRIGAGERGGGRGGGGGGRGGGGSERREGYPYGAVYSRSFDTGEFFSGVGSSTPVASPSHSRRRRGESGDSSSRRGGDRHHNSRDSSARVAEPSASRSGGRGGGEVPHGGSASTTFDAPRTQGSRQSQAASDHPGRWFSSYADCHATAATPTAATGGEESWGDGGRRGNPTRRRRSSAAVVAGSGGTKGTTGDSSYYGS